jgi:hypothetical protein
MKYATEVASAGMIYIPNFITIGSGIQVILWSLLQQFEKVQCWYTNGRDLKNVLLRGPQVSSYMYQVSCRSV